MQILVPLAGNSTFFKPEDYPFPKPLIEVGGTPMIERVVENLARIDAQPKFIFVVRQDDVARFSLDRTLRLIADGCEIVTLRNETKGALCSALMAIDHIEQDSPLLICNSDQVIDADLNAIVQSFFSGGFDAGVVTFESVHPRWSYVEVNAERRVLQAAEKRVISRNAIAGFYFFRTGKTFIQGAMRSIANDSRTDGLFYIAPTLNELILDSCTVSAYAIPENRYHSFYSPAKIQEFEKTQLVRTIRTAMPTTLSDVRVVVPAAGEGNRFRNAGFALPKPFIDVLNRPMIERVLDNVRPSGARVHVLLRTEHTASFPEITQKLADHGARIHTISALTEGTVCTLLLARREFDDEKPLLVANSDQLVDFSVNSYVQDCLDRGLDGSILVFREPNRDTKWSYAQVDKNGLVIRVAEKKAISDLATVGIYFFTRGASFVDAAMDMIARNDRVNNEFYTCPVYNYMIANGLQIGVYEVSAMAMHGLGTPDDLSAYLESKRDSAG